jgi:ABC-2 type transport system ATP-binding protein
LRDSASTVAGSRSVVEDFVAHRDVLRRETLGGLATATVGRLDETARREAAAVGLELAPVSLQELIVRKTNSSTAEFGGNS